MSLGDNIRNAFSVVAQTYENVNKLMDYCKAAASEKGEFELMTPKFLRYKSDVNTRGWFIGSFILLFQSTMDKPIEHNGWRDGPVYVLELNLHDGDVDSEPLVNIARFTYDDILSWSEGCSPTNHWVFYDPLYGQNIEYMQEGADYDGQVTDTAHADKWHWGLRRITGKEVPLTDITYENAYDVIFGGFRSLMDN